MCNGCNGGPENICRSNGRSKAGCKGIRGCREEVLANEVFISDLSDDNPVASITGLCEIEVTEDVGDGKV